MPLTPEQEKTQQASLYLKQNQKKFQQDFRGDLMQRNESEGDDNNIPQESVQKHRLALLKANAIKQANAGGAVGASVGGTVFSIIPFIGTGFGIFLGRFIGKKLGITGIVIFVILLLLALLLVFIVVLKGYCDSLSYISKTIDYVTLDICKNFQ